MAPPAPRLWLQEHGRRLERRWCLLWMFGLVTGSLPKQGTLSQFAPVLHEEVEKMLFSRLIVTHVCALAVAGQDALALGS